MQEEFNKQAILELIVLLVKKGILTKEEIREYKESLTKSFLDVIKLPIDK